MANPQQPELRRSEQIPALSPDAAEAEVEAQEHDLRLRQGSDDDPADAPAGDGAGDQDQPDLDRFAEKFGVVDENE